ncbi:MAG: lysophospholipid acyltransferase family protein [Micrococcaceae bacterium]
MTPSNTVRSSVRTMLKTTCRPEVKGLENVPDSGGFIVASNHLSFFDSVIIQAMSPRMVHFFAKAEYFNRSGLKGRLMKGFFESVGSIPVERGEQAASVAALDELVQMIESGQGVGIYPEGTRSRDGRLYRGRTGVGWLALATGAPVLPVGLADTDRLQPPGRTMALPHKFSLTVGRPIEVERLGRKHSLPIRRETTERIMNEIAAITGQERVDQYNSTSHPDSTR